VLSPFDASDSLCHSCVVLDFLVMVVAGGAALTAFPSPPRTLPPPRSSPTSKFGGTCFCMSEVVLDPDVQKHVPPIQLSGEFGGDERRVMAAESK
jgi:hypothetical protein